MDDGELETAVDPGNVYGCVNPGDVGTPKSALIKSPKFTFVLL